MTTEEAAMWRGIYEKTPREKLNRLLNQIRKTGAINMFGVAPYLVRDIGVTQQEADLIAVTYPMRGLPEIADEK